METRPGQHKYWLNIYARIASILMVLSKCGCQRDCNDPSGYGLERWGEWSNGRCSFTCGNGIVRITRTRCCYEEPDIDSSCVGISTTETTYEACSLRQCPINGFFNEWGEWNNPPCSVTCGESATKVITRTRTCNAPQHGGKDCVGSLTEAKSTSCGLCPCQVDGGYTAWNAWSIPPCPSTCGSSVTVKTRSRTCSNPTPNHGGRPCSGSTYETSSHTCTLGPCPVDGVVSEWGPWNNIPCHVTCGASATKVITRTRTCSPPQHGGHQCTDSQSETRTECCGAPACPARVKATSDNASLDTDLDKLITAGVIGAVIGAIVAIAVGAVVHICLVRHGRLQWNKSEDSRQSTEMSDLRNPHGSSRTEAENSQSNTAHFYNNDYSVLDTTKSENKVYDVLQDTNKDYQNL